MRNLFYTENDFYNFLPVDIQDNRDNSFLFLSETKRKILNNKRSKTISNVFKTTPSTREK